MISVVSKAKISISYGYTKNLGNYESERVDARVERDLDEKEDVKQACEMEFRFCKDFVKKSLGLDYKPDENVEQEVKEMLSRRNRRRNA